MIKILEKIEEKYKSSLKEKNQTKIKTYRLIKSAINDKDISLRSENDKIITDEDIFKILQSLIKQRKESFEMYSKGGRKNLAEIEMEEIKIIKALLPEQFNPDETKTLITQIIKEVKVESIKDMGKVMATLKTKYSGKIDMSLAGQLAKQIIQEKN
ncbi:MAG: glutamyl-tRNA amidotransferase [Candidatus Marinimicrobia bacterium]|nr:glutamyl-tRNA amidotransferase [Candidatus Neomarinimicrobiota bacterium]